MIKYGFLVLLCVYAAQCQAKMPSCSCPRNYAPLCGNDGNTYPNECVLECEQSKNEQLQMQHTGECTKENPEQSCVCALIYKPVCGTDGNTYPNECSLNCARKQNPNLKVRSQGQCQKENLVARSPCVCTFIYQPVCGSNGKTYPNPCTLNCESKENPSLTLKHQGECQKENIKLAKPCICPRLFRPVCASDGRTYSNPCNLKCSNPNLLLAHQGPCKKNMERRDMPTECKCNRIYDPVCGDNGRTYGNECLLKCDAQESGRNIQKSHEGRCEDSEP